MYLSKPVLDQILSRRDLTREPHHAIGIIVDQIKCALELKYSTLVLSNPGHAVVSVEDNYYSLGYDANDITLSSTYTRYISAELMLRTQMSSTIPGLLREYPGGDNLYLCAGQVYRRDVRDKTHVGEPHQCDIWYITEKKQTRQDLLELVEVIIGVIEKAKNKKIKWRYQETQHNYTDEGIEVEIYHNNQWLEILECGLVGQKLLNKHNLSNYGGLALGLGLDRLVMIIKEIEDIRVLLSQDSRIQAQLSNLEKYKSVSNQPSMKRDLSLSVLKDKTIEDLTETIMEKMSQVEIIESIQLLSETSYDNLPDIARSRLGIQSHQKNVLLRIVLRDLEKTLSSGIANCMYEDIYSLLHENKEGYAITHKLNKSNNLL